MNLGNRFSVLCEEMHRCLKEGCSKSYTTERALLHHIRQVHCEEEKKKCPHCDQVFATIISKNRHESNCPATKTKLWIPQSEIITQQNNNRHVHIATKLTPQADQILSSFKSFMTNAGYSTLLKGFKRKLTDNSISTYALHLRSFFQYIQEGTKDNDDLVLYSMDINVIKNFLSYKAASAYCNKTIANKLFAMERLMGFYHSEIQILNNNGLTKATSSAKFIKKIEDTFEFLKTESKIVSPAANRDTIVRNSRETLEAEGKWIELPILLDKFAGIVN